MTKALKSILSLILILALALCALPAMAESPITNSMPKVDGKEQPVVIKRGKSAVVLCSKVNSGSGNVTLTVKDQTNKNAIIKTESRSVSVGSTIEWKIDFDEQLTQAKVNVKHYVMVVSMDNKSYTYSLYLTYTKKDDTITVEKGTWYSNNTACVQGLVLRDMKNPITDKWYHVLPLDLSKQGTQEFQYLAGNMYIIGKVSVTVDGDTLTVTYHNYYDQAGGNTKTLDEYMTIFHNIKDIRTVDPDKLGSGYGFGQKISIQNDLGGDTNVILYILNHVTYCDYVTGTHKLTRYWPNLQENKDYRKNLEVLMQMDDDTLLTSNPDGSNG